MKNEAGWQGRNALATTINFCLREAALWCGLYYRSQPCCCRLQKLMRSNPQQSPCWYRACWCCSSHPQPRGCPLRQCARLLSQRLAQSHGYLVSLRYQHCLRPLRLGSQQKALSVPKYRYWVGEPPFAWLLARFGASRRYWLLEWLRFAPTCHPRSMPMQHPKPNFSSNDST